MTNPRADAVDALAHRIRALGVTQIWCSQGHLTVAEFIDAILDPRHRAALLAVLLDPETLVVGRAQVAELDERLSAWMDRHYTNEYPFQEAYEAFHESAYGHPRGSAISPCENCRLTATDSTEPGL